MKTISSFTINHDILQKGMYIAKVDRDVVTYDIRMALPNQGCYLNPATAHTFEHLFATYVRNSKYADFIVYVGPMGCRPGFYFLVRDNLSHQQALDLVKETFAFIKSFRHSIPGAGSSSECGNYLEHDLEGARLIAIDMLNVLSDWTVEDMTYRQ